MRLSRQTLAYLRAIAEGVPVVTAARAYLVDDGRSAEAAHQGAVQAAVFVARRAGLGSRWRLLRAPLALPRTESNGSSDPATPQLAAPAAKVPTLEEWAEAEGLEDWSADELQALYAERFSHADPRALRKAAQAERLRLSRLELLAQLEAYAVEPPSLSDPVSGWFPEQLAGRLEAAGFHTVGELRSAIAIGGRWWSGVRAFGPKKAQDLAGQILALVGLPPAPGWTAARVGPELSGQAGDNRGTAPQISAANDREAIDAFINARTSSTQTARAYRREAERFLLWLLVERKQPLSGANTDDCRAYMTFLGHVPAEWVSKRHARRLEAGWAPFAGQPSVDSQRYALTVLVALFTWLVRVGYLRSDPWAAINKRLPDDPHKPMATSRAFTPAAWQALIDHLPALKPAAEARMRWLLLFSQATGLRASELVNARRADLTRTDEGHWLQVHGKGAKNRLVAVPSTALEATRAYFRHRGLDLDTASPDTPLLAHLEPQVPGKSLTPEAESEEVREAKKRRALGFIAYRTLYDVLVRFVQSALKASSLSVAEQAHARRASVHWLRHTHATRVAESGLVPPDVLQANLGQADPSTTAHYYRAQEKRRQDMLEAVFGQG